MTAGCPDRGFDVQEYRELHRVFFSMGDNEEKGTISSMGRQESSLVFFTLLVHRASTDVPPIRGGECSLPKTPEAHCNPATDASERGMSPQEVGASPPKITDNGQDS